MPLDAGISNRTNNQSLQLMPVEHKRKTKENQDNLFYDFPLFDKPSQTRLHPFVNFNGQISIRDFLFPVQEFALSEKDSYVFIENYPKNSFPKIQITLEEKNFVYEVKDFTVRPSDNSVQGEILYTRFFLTTAENKKCTLNFKDIDFVPFNFSFSDLASEEKKQTLYRAKLFRKLGFIEEVFKIKFNVPENITAVEAQRIDVLFRGITEGKFSNPAGNSITVFNYKIGEEDLKDTSFPKRRNFSFEFDEDFLVLGKFFHIGKMKFMVKKASIANPRILKNLDKGDIVPNLRLNVFDHQVHHDFKKYSNLKKIKTNKQRLERFKNHLRKEEPEYLVALLDESLPEIDEKAAVEIIEGLLQYHDFPDRFSVLTPELKESHWKVPIALTYPKNEPINLIDAFVDVRTGKVEMEISFDELLKKGKRKAEEVFTIG